MSAASDPAVRALTALLHRLGLDAPGELLDEHFLSHPDYPSLAAFSDTLTVLGVPHDALQAPMDSLRELPRPHLAYLDDEGFAVVERIEGDRVLLAERGELPLSRYLELWSGVVLVPTGAPDAQVRSARTTRAPNLVLASATLTTLVVLASMSFALWAEPSSLVALGLFGFSVVGLVASALLTAESLGLQTAARKFCQLGRKASCSAVLASRAARVGPFSMADIGIGFFAGGLLVSLLATLHSPARQLVELALTGLAVLSLPYTVFSVFYQGFVVKRWCPLCLLVVAVLWAEVVLGLLSFPRPVGSVAGASAWSVLVLFPVPFGLWSLAKPLLVRSLQLRERQIEYERLIRDPVIIQTLIDLETPAELPSVPIQVECGPAGAPVTVTVYTDPTCAFCRERHIELEDAMTATPEGLRVVSRVLRPTHADERSLGLIQALANDLAEGRAAEAHARLSRWFRGERVATAGTTLPPAAQELLVQHRALQARPPFRETPVIFVGERRWPSRLPLRAVSHLARARLEER